MSFNKNKHDIKLTEERMIPKLMNPRNGMLKEHIARYKFAISFARGRVLDIACGVGYGSDILLNENDSIESYVGVDIDINSINYAKEHYYNSLASYMEKDALSPCLADQIGKFDTVISFETVEHIKEDTMFIQNLITLLKPTGKLIISTPFGRGRGITCSDPFHIQQYKEEEFTELLSDFKNVEMYYQLDEMIEKRIEAKKYYLMVAICSMD